MPKQEVYSPARRNLIERTKHKVKTLPFECFSMNMDAIDRLGESIEQDNMALREVLAHAFPKKRAP